LIAVGSGQTVSSAAIAVGYPLQLTTFAP